MGSSMNSFYIVNAMSSQTGTVLLVHHFHFMSDLEAGVVKHLQWSPHRLLEGASICLRRRQKWRSFENKPTKMCMLKKEKKDFLC